MSKRISQRLLPLVMPAHVGHGRRRHPVCGIGISTSRRDREIHDSGHALVRLRKHAVAHLCWKDLLLLPQLHHAAHFFLCGSRGWVGG